MSATVASLQARADGAQFTLTQTANTPLRSGSMPLQTTHPLQALVPHGSTSRTAISWTAVYRTRRLAGDTLVVDSAVAASFLQLVLDHVNTVFDAIDLNMNLVGYPANRTVGPVGQPNTTPGLPPGS
jgi:hypothetical protein